MTSEMREVLNRLFDRYDRNRSQFIEREEVPQLMIDTYNTIGLQFTPNERDIDSYMSNMDLSQDGLISREEFFEVCGKSLRDRGLDL